MKTESRHIFSMRTFSVSQISRVFEPFFSSSNEQHESTKEKQAKIGETVEFTEWLENHDYFREAKSR